MVIHQYEKKKKLLAGHIHYIVFFRNGMKLISFSIFDNLLHSDVRHNMEKKSVPTSAT